MTSTQVPSGTVWRYDAGSGRGIVYVFRPNNYAGTGTVVYVHGYYDDVDSAWNKYRLLGQFASSGKPALFVAVEAPKARGEKVRWSSLSTLLSSLAKNIGFEPPRPVTAIAHSAGFETVAQWLSDPALVHVTLLDALYGYVNAYKDWALKPGHTLDLVVTRSGKPRTNSESVLSRLARVVSLKEVPETWPPGALAAGTVFVLSSLTHMGLVQPGTSIIGKMLDRAPIGSPGQEGRESSGGAGLVLAVGAVVVLLFLLR